MRSRGFEPLHRPRRTGYLPSDLSVALLKSSAFATQPTTHKWQVQDSNLCKPYGNRV